MRHLAIEEWMSWRFFGHQEGGRISNRSLKKETLVDHSEGFGAVKGMNVHTAAMKTAKKRTEEMISQVELIESK